METVFTKMDLDSVFPVQGVRDGVIYRLLSADAVDFAPQRLL